APRLATKPVDLMAACTRRSVSGPTRSGRLRTFDTVPIDTPATRATARMPRGWFSFAVLIRVAPAVPWVRRLGGLLHRIVPSDADRGHDEGGLRGSGPRIARHVERRVIVRACLVDDARSQPRHRLDVDDERLVVRAQADRPGGEQPRMSALDVGEVGVLADAAGDPVDRGP